MRTVAAADAGRAEKEDVVKKVVVRIAVLFNDHC